MKMNPTTRQTESSHHLLLRTFWEVLRALAVVGGALTALNFTYKIYKWMRTKISIESLIVIGKFTSFSFWFVLTYFLISEFGPLALATSMPFILIPVFLTALSASVGLYFLLNELTGFDLFGTTATGPYLGLLVILFDFPYSAVEAIWGALDSWRGSEDGNQNFTITILAITLWLMLIATLAVLG